jgi:tRNA threonylcarbamoyladenosine biosynthesis protein TsaE
MTREDVTFRSVSLEELSNVAEEVVRYNGEVKVWLLKGDLGAGKTTLIKAIGERLGVRDTMSSPSFSIVNEYEAEKIGKVFHFDFYRIKNEGEAFDIGVEDYFYSGYPCFVEWPDKIPSLIPPVFASIKIEIENESHRTIAISVHDGQEENRV